MIGINGAVVPGQQQTIDLTKTDEYGVTVTTGAPFNTMREEAAEYYKQIVMTTPDMMPVIGDLVFKYQDFPGAQAISDRLRRTVPPHLLGEEQQGPTPEQQQIAQMEQALQALQAENAQLEQELKAKVQEVQVKAQTELAKNDTEKQKQQVEVMRLSLEREQARADHAIQQQEIRVKQEELDLKRKELSLKLTAEASADRGQPL